MLRVARRWWCSRLSKNPWISTSTTISLRDIHSSDRRCPVGAGFCPIEQALEVQLQVKLIVPSRPTVYADGTILTRAAIGLTQKLHVDVMGEGPQRLISDLLSKSSVLIRTSTIPKRLISRLNHTARLLAVYASQCRLPIHHARLASGCWLGLAGWDWLPTRFHYMVSRWSSNHPILLVQASPGARSTQIRSKPERQRGRHPP